jgi:membrane protein
VSDRDEEAVKTGFFATIPWANFVRISRHFIGFLWHRFVENDCLRLAASLSYTSMLAIVPLTAIAFSMLAAFPVFEGVREEFQSVLFKNFLPTSAEAMRDYFDQFVDNTAKLTAVGIIGLALIAVLLLGTIESALNSIFRVIRPRALLPRLLVFWALLTLGPLLLGASFSLSTYFFALTKSLGGEALTGVGGFLKIFAPTAIMIVVFTLFYLVIPNRSIKFSNALIGGVTAGVMFAVLREVLTLYVSNLPIYQTIYGAASVVPIFLVWTYLSWAAVLLGAVLTSSLEEWRSREGIKVQANRLRAGRRLVLAVGVLQQLFEAGKTGRGVLTTAMVRETKFGTEAVERMLFSLHKNKYIENTSSDTWVLARRLKDVTLYELMRSLEIGFNPTDFDISTDSWRQNLMPYLKELLEGEKKSSDISLQAIFEAGEKERDGQLPSHLKPVS